MSGAEPAEAPVGGTDQVEVPGQAGRARAGHEVAFTDFYRATTPSLVAFLVVRGARLADAADVAQETMAAAYRRRHDLDHPRAWAFRVASRALARRLASAREEPVAEPPEPSPLLRPTAIENWERHHDVARAVTRLPERQRQVMAWTLAGSTPAEIAAELGLRADTVRSTLLKARRALIRDLHGNGGDR
ncbi:MULTISPECIES: RNA polymerase sigma factor [Saccharothrix]|uniref:RNA polymerase sigma factor n=1 Tax=Saccharothrix TaxID=2071 RepID=UPI000963A470|nr:sigma-70 family RNA polymerase sigma factor [Saccharothrix sp. CB00851]OKI34542.1 hypothetical protein A6A25_25045 [Saccharothrix sp. CB00851]